MWDAHRASGLGGRCCFPPTLFPSCWLPLRDVHIHGRDRCAIPILDQASSPHHVGRGRPASSLDNVLWTAGMRWRLPRAPTLLESAYGFSPGTVMRAASRSSAALLRRGDVVARLPTMADAVHAVASASSRREPAIIVKIVCSSCSTVRRRLIGTALFAYYFAKFAPRGDLAFVQRRAASLASRTRGGVLAKRAGEHMCYDIPSSLLLSDLRGEASPGRRLLPAARCADEMDVPTPSPT